MFKYLFLFTTIYITNNIFAQTRNEKVIWVCDTIINCTNKIHKYQCTDRTIVIKRDKFGRELEKIKQHFVTDKGRFITFKKLQSVYNGKGKIIEKTEYCWQEDLKKWIAVKKTTYTYINDKPLNETVYQKNPCNSIIKCRVGGIQYVTGGVQDLESQNWKEYTRWVYEYDSSGELINKRQHTKCYINKETKKKSHIDVWSYEPIKSEEYTFSNKKLIEKYVQRRDWYMESPEKTKFSYSYEPENIIKITELKWDKRTSKWNKYKEKEYKYADDDKLIEESDYYYNVNNAGKWQLLKKQTVKYDSKDNITDKLYYNYDYIDEVWVLKQAYKYIYEYNKNGKLLRKSKKYMKNYKWNDDSEYLYVYDENNNLIKRIVKTKILGKDKLQEAYKIEYKYRKFIIK